MNVYKIGFIPDDCVGPEMVKQSKKILKSLELKFKNTKDEVIFDLVEIIALSKSYEMGLGAISSENLNLALQQDGIIIGNIGDPKYNHLPRLKRPDQALLKLRQALNLSSNIRPIYTHKETLCFSPLKRRF